MQHTHDTPLRIARITLFVDDPDAWIVPWAESLRRDIGRTYHVSLVHDPAAMAPGDVCFLLGCTRLLPPELLSLHRLNLVVHESALPAGRGFSPVGWQILEGKNTIPVTLFAATAGPDTGPVYLQDEMLLRGDELLPELRARQGAKTVEMVKRFLDLWPDLTASPQQGEASHYRRRTRTDDELDPSCSLAVQFDHLRIVDNERYPAWFRFRGRSYLLKIEPAPEGFAPDAGNDDRLGGAAAAEAKEC